MTLGIKTLRLLSLSIMKLSVTLFLIMAVSMSTLGIIGLNGTLGMKHLPTKMLDLNCSGEPYIFYCFAECRYSECRWSECFGASVV
jgi:hypothetical protein